LTADQLIVTGNTAHTQPENRLFFPALDGLRAVAFLLVFFTHYAALPWGFAGVNIFFVLSGFLITGILFDSRGDPCRARNFYIRRTLRIFPLYYAVFLVLLLLAPILHWQWTLSWLAWPLYLGNFLILRSPQVMVINSPQAVSAFGHLYSARFPVFAFIGHFWSICVEEQFYLFWPAIVFLTRSRRALIWVCGITVVVVPLLRELAQHTAPAWMLQAEMLYRITPFQLDSLLLGGLIALLWRGVHRGRLLAVARIVAWLCAVVAVVYLAVTVRQSMPDWAFGYRYPSWYAPKLRRSRIQRRGLPPGLPRIHPQPDPQPPRRLLRDHRRQQRQHRPHPRSRPPLSRRHGRRRAAQGPHLRPPGRLRRQHRRPHRQRRRRLPPHPRLGRQSPHHLRRSRSPPRRQTRHAAPLAAFSGPLVYYDLTPRQRVLVHVFYMTAWTTYAINRYILRVGSMVQGGNFVVSRAALEAIGGFNTAISFYGEDTDIARRLNDVGEVRFTFDLKMSPPPAASRAKACSPWPPATPSTTSGPPSSSAPSPTPTSTSANRMERPLIPPLPSRHKLRKVGHRIQRGAEDPLLPTLLILRHKVHMAAVHANLLHKLRKARRRRQVDIRVRLQPMPVAARDHQVPRLLRQLRRIAILRTCRSPFSSIA
jgi:peptidoglycan/LPS O-acetylase OafA/YrhL